MNIEVSEELKSKCPEFRGIAVEAWVSNTAFSKELWQEIDVFTQQLRAESNVDDCKEQYAIAATRTAYRRCGKDLSRYRPSAEALRRRLLRGLELYQIDTLVDIINLVSLQQATAWVALMPARLWAINLFWASGVKVSPTKASGVVC